MLLSHRYQGGTAALSKHQHQIVIAARRAPVHQAKPPTVPTPHGHGAVAVWPTILQHYQLLHAISVHVAQIYLAQRPDRQPSLRFSRGILSIPSILP